MTCESNQNAIQQFWRSTYRDLSLVLDYRTPQKSAMQSVLTDTANEFAAAIADVAAVACRGADPTRAIQAVAERALALIGCESVSIALITQGSGRLDVVAVAGRDPKEHTFGFRIEGSIAEEVLRAGRSFVSNQLQLPMLDDVIETRFAVVPISDDGHSLGVLIAFEADHGLERDLPILEAFASLVPIALRVGELTVRSASQGAELSVLYDVATKIGVSQFFADVCQALIDSIWQHLRPRTVGLFLLNDDKTHLLLADHRGLPDALREVQLPVEHPSIAAALANGQSSRLSDIQFEADFGSFLPGLEVQAALLAPILSRTDCLGVILVISSESDAYASHDSQLLSTIGSHAGAAIQNALLVEDQQRNTEELNSLYALARDIGSTMDVPRILEHVVTHVRDLLRVDGAAVLLFDRQSDRLVNRCYEGPSLPELASSRFRRGDGIPGWVFEHLISANIASVGVDPRNASLPINGVESLLCLPLSSTQRDYGVLLALSTFGRSFAEQEVRLLDTITRHACMAIENATAYHEARVKSQTLRKSFNRMAAALGISAVAGVIPEEISQLILTMMEADACLIYSIDNASDGEVLIDSEVLCLRSALGVRPGFHDPVPAIGSGLSGWVARRGRFLAVDDLKEDPRSELHPRLKDKYASYMAIPLRVAKTTVGVLEIYSVAPRSFLKEESDLLSRFAKHARIAERVTAPIIAATP